MPNQIFVEENRNYQIDFSSANWASDDANRALRKFQLQDVDWIVETDDGILMVEYKNSCVERASNPSAFERKVRSDEHYLKIAHKFFDSLTFLILHNKNLANLKYVYIVEFSLADSTLRKRMRQKIKQKLPFESNNDLAYPLISEFSVLSIDEWNLQYPQFPLIPFIDTYPPL